MERVHGFPRVHGIPVREVSAASISERGDRNSAGDRRRDSED